MLDLFKGRVPNLSFLTATLLALVMAGACGDDEPTGPFDPDCPSCRSDGETCEFSRNCKLGSICNRRTDPLYVAEQDEGVCVRVACETDADCESPRTCSLEKICGAPICQKNADCEGGNVCIGGRCDDQPNPAAAKSCEVLSSGGVILTGQSRTLSAIARNELGNVVTGISFVWSTSASDSVSISEGQAVGGAAAGDARVTAAVGAIVCMGAATFTNLVPAPVGDLRVIAASATSGLPVAGASIYVDTATQTVTGSTGVDGAIIVPGVGASDVRAVTVSKTGFTPVTALSPGTADLLLSMPEDAPVLVASGFRGLLDISGTESGDVQLGLVATAFPSTLVDIDLAALVGESIPTAINAPELGLDTTTDLPGGLLLGLGTTVFTNDASTMAKTRCQDIMMLPPGHLGCFLLPTRGGAQALWSFGGQLKLSEVSNVIGLITGALDGGFEDLPVGDLLVEVLPLLSNLRHGIDGGRLAKEEKKKKLDMMSMVDCMVAENAADPALCGPDLKKYTKLTIDTDAKLEIKTAIEVPPMPAVGEGFTPAALAIAGALVADRGFIPLGLSAGLDTLNDGDVEDGIVSGATTPFGPQSEALADGFIPMQLAAPHGGIEESDLAVIIFALDPAVIAGTVDVALSGIVDVVGTFSAEERILTPFMPPPAGTFATATFTFTPSSATEGAEFTRLDISKGDAKWLVWVPHSAAPITLPDHGTLRADVVGDEMALVYEVMAAGPSASFPGLFTPDSGATVAELGPHLESFAVRACAVASDAICRIE